MGIGCLLKIDKYEFSNPKQDYSLVMITDYNYSNLNVFCALGHGTTKYQSNTTVGILDGTTTDVVNVKALSSILGNDLLHSDWWHDAGMVHVINPMPWEPDQQWLESEWDEVLNWFFNDLNKKDLHVSGLWHFIEHWSNFF